MAGLSTKVKAPCCRGEQGDLYIGDGQGSIRRLVLVASEAKNGLRQEEVETWSNSLSSHALGITTLVAEAHEGVMLSMGNDACVKVWEHATSSNKKTHKNDRRCRYAGMALDSTHQDVYLVDDKGFLTVWNWMSEKTIFCEVFCPCILATLLPSVLLQSCRGPSDHKRLPSAGA